MKDLLDSAEVMSMRKARYDTIIVGLGKTGLSCVRYLQKQGKKNFAVMDSRSEPPYLADLQAVYPHVPFYTGEFDRELLSRADEVILSPGVALSEPAIQQAIECGVSVYGDVELFCRQITKPIVAVTGSNGKSTVVTLISEMVNASGFKAGLGGNIGTPVLDLLEAPEPDFYVLELSSFQLESVQSLNAIASVVLNISEDHMDRYPDLDSYAAAKLRIHRGDGCMVVNRDEDFTSAIPEEQDRSVITYGLDRPLPRMFGIRTIEAERWLVRGEETLLPETELGLYGDHNLSNVLAALALGTAIELPMEAMLAALREFTGLAHRCQLVERVNGVAWYNDSKGTNVGATCAAIEGLARQGNIILIAGGEGKDADFTPLLQSAAGRVGTAILLGKDAPGLAAAIEESIPVCFATTMLAAVETAAGLAKEGDVVLLSPACASFDMFADYQARGEAFISAVRNLPQGGGR